MGRKRLSARRWAARSCFLGVWAWTLSCSGREIKGLGTSHGGALPGETSLLPHRLGKEIAGALAHGGRGKAAVLAGEEGAITVSAGINPFFAPAARRLAARGVVSNGQETVKYNPPGANKTVAIDIVAPTSAVVGTNLFESFSQFELFQNDVADFQSPSGVNDIIARITGGNRSLIDGEIESGQGVNLFLINPSGVVFGPQASLAVGGSFTVSTADVVNLSDGGVFHSSLGAKDTLTSAPVSGFGFDGTAPPASVGFRGSQLSLRPGAGLNVIAGDVILDGASIIAPSGNLAFFSAASGGEVPFSLAAPGSNFGATTVGTLGTVSLSNGSLIAIDGEGGGQVIVQAGAITVQSDSAIRALDLGSATGGNISVDAQGLLTLATGGQILAAAQGSGQSGNVNVQAGSLNISGEGAEPGVSAGILDEARLGEGGTGSGSAGNINVTVEGAIDLGFRGQIVSATYTSGNAGHVSVTANSMAIDGSIDPAVLTGIDANSAASATGNAGSVDVTVAGALNIQSGGKIRSATNSSGNAGNVTVHAGVMDIDGSGTVTGKNVFTGIDAESTKTATGNGMDVDVFVDGALDIGDGGQINASTSSSGDGGDVTVHAGSMDINGSGAATSTGIVNESIQGGLTDGGPAGSVGVIVAGALDIETGGQIISATYSPGPAGNVTVRAATMDIDGSGDPARLTGIDSSSLSMAHGNAGSVGVTVTGALYIESGGKILSATKTSGNAGDVTVHARSMSIQGSGLFDGAPTFTGIDAESKPGSTGYANDIGVFVKQGLDIQGGGEITASTASIGAAGSVVVDAGSLDINGSGAPLGSPSGILDESEQGAVGAGGGAAGNLTVNVNGALVVDNRGEITADTYTSGMGGQVKVAAGEIIVESGGQIAATTTSTGIGGSVNVHAGSLDILGMSGATTGIDTFSEQSPDGGPGGAAGNINVQVAGVLNIDGQGQIDASTSTSQMGGAIAVNAGTLNINHSQIVADTFSTGVGGTVKVHAGNMNIVDGEIDANTTLSGQGGGIAVAASNLTLTDGGQIDANALSTGGAGTVVVHAGVLDVLDNAQIDANTFSSGIGGTVDVGAGTVILDNGGVIAANTVSAGGGGNVNVQAGLMDISGGAGELTGIYVISAAGKTGGSGGAAGDLTLAVGGALNIAGKGEIDASTSTSGKGGDIKIKAGYINLAGGPGVGSEIIASTSSSGGGGQVNIHANSLNIGGSSIIGATSQKGATGAAGNLSIDLQDGLAIENGGEINASTASSKSAGIVTIHANNLDIDGDRELNVFTGILDESLAGNTGDSGGDARDIDITVNGALTVVGGGQITAQTATGGVGGSINIQAGSINIEDASQIIASTQAGGAGGTVNVNAGTMNIGGAAMIQATSEPGATGAAGDLKIDLAGGLSIQSGGEITASTASSKKAGSVTLQVGSLDINGLKPPAGDSTGIFDESDPGNKGDTGGMAGNLNITVLGGLNLRYGGDISATTATAGGGGNLHIHAGSMDIASGGAISASTTAMGNAGNVNVDAGSLEIDGFGTRPGGATGIIDISRRSGTGDAGGAAGDLNINVANTLALEGGGEITAATHTAGNGGYVQIRAGNVNISRRSEIAASTYSAGPGGVVILDADSLNISRLALIEATSELGATGRAGAVVIDLSGGLTIQSGGEISVSTSSSKVAGEVFVEAGSVDINGAGAPEGDNTGILDESLQGLAGDSGGAASGISLTVAHTLTVQGQGGEITAATSTAGNGGSVRIKADTLDIESNGQIIASTSSGGMGGEVTVTADSLNIGGSGMIEATSEQGAMGNAGNLAIDISGGITIQTGGEITASTASSMRAGKMTIQAASMDIEGSGGSTGILDQSLPDGEGASGGAAGDLNINITSLLTVQGLGGEITASTDTSGIGGNITINAGTLNVENTGQINAATSGGGMGGYLAIHANSLDIGGSAMIAATSNPGATGAAGDIVINLSGGLTIEGGGKIAASTYSAYQAGSIILRAASIDINGFGVHGGGSTGIIDQSLVDTEGASGGGAGDLNIDVTNLLTVQGPGGEITASTATIGMGGDISINAGAVNVENMGQINAATSGAGMGGYLSIHATSMDIGGSAMIAAASNPGATGPAGDIVINLSGGLTIESGGEIAASTYSAYQAGSVIIGAASVDINGSGNVGSGPTGILDQSLVDNSGPSGGAAGDLAITVTGGLVVQNGGEVTAATSTSGQGGSIMIDAGTLNVETTGQISAATSSSGAGGAIGIKTGALQIQSNGQISAATSSSARGGDLIIKAGPMDIEGGGEITASTTSSGRAGDVTIQSSSVNIDGMATPPGGLTGILDQSAPGAQAGSGGAAGDLRVTVTGALDIDSGGEITASTSASGAAGAVDVLADTLDIDGAKAPAGLSTGILDISTPGYAGNTGGAAGDVAVAVGRALAVENGGEITAATNTSGKGGNLTIQAGSIEVSGASSNIQVASLGSGNAGEAGGVSIASGDLTVENGGAISAKASNSSGGDIVIQIGQSMDLSDGSITAAAGNSGGDITISANSLGLERGSMISADAVQGAGGILDFNLPLDAVLGQTSDFVLIGQQVFQSGDSTISATSDAGIPGQLRSSAPYVDLANGLVALGGSVVDANTHLEDTCAVSIQGQFSSFLEIGQGDIEAAPDQALGETGDVAAHPRKKMKAHHGK